MHALAEPTLRQSIALATSDDEPAARFLTAGEHAVYTSLPGERRRRDWVAGRLAAKRAVAETIGITDLDFIELRYEPRRAPTPVLVVADSVHPIPVSLSIAHCEGRAAAVAAPAPARVGVDLERLGGVGAMRLRYFLTQAEQEATRSVDRTALWALKEAAWKALGCDDRTPFTAIELSFDADGRIRSVWCEGQKRPAAAVVSNPWPGFVLAVIQTRDD